MILQGDIIIAPFPYSDFSSTKIRPSLVISNNSVNATGDIIAIGISSTPPLINGITLSDKDFSKGSLSMKSHAVCHKIHLIDKNLVKGTVARLKPATLKLLIQLTKHLITPSGRTKRRPE